MTALSGPILFNATTGNDGTSSGCGPSVAVTETITTVAASNSATVTSGTGYSVGDLMYIPSATGRKFNVIATISGTTITFDDPWDDSLTSVSAYVGGKRATFDNADSRRIFADDAVTSATIETETDQTINSKLVIGGSGSVSDLFTVKGSTGSEVITQTANTYTIGTGGYNEGFGGDYISVEDLVFENTNASKSSAIVIDSSATVTYARNLKAVSASNNHSTFLSRSAGGQAFIFDSCSIKNCTGTGVNLSGFSYSGVAFFYCDISDNGSYGIYSNRDLNEVHGCVFANNGNTGVSVNTARYSNSIFFSNSGSGLSTYYQTSIVGCIFYGNTVYGIANNNTQRTYLFKNNAFGSNGSGDIQSAIPFEDNSITLTADPFVDAANGDFNLNATNGGGGTLRSTNYTLGG